MRLGLTGASGFLGGNLAMILIEAGHEVIATRRGSSQIKHLAALPIQWVEADLSDVDALSTAFAGCEGVFHCAAAVSIRYKIEPWIEAANIQGTANVIEACRRAGVGRLVHCSTTSVIGLSTDGEPCDERASFNMPAHGLGDAYVMTKRAAQELALKAAAEGMDIVVVNPAYLIGPYDSKPSSSRLVLDAMKRKIPGYTTGRNNFADVRDVARGMLAAFQKGRKGELYILGGHNLTYKDFLERVAAVTGTPPLRRAIPRWAAMLAGRFGDLQIWLTGKEPLLNTATIRWSFTDSFIVRSDKAIRELGYTISPIEGAIEDCAAWFRQEGRV